MTDTQTFIVCLGEFPYPEWHKREKENILSAVGIKVEYGESLYEGEYRGTFRTVSDREHAEIVRLYVEENLGMDVLGRKIRRSTRTVNMHIRKHNQAVQRSGFCMPCKRAGSSYFNKKAVRGQT